MSASKKKVIKSSAILKEIEEATHMNFDEYIKSVSKPQTIKTYKSIYKNHLSQFANENGVIPVSKQKQILDYIDTLDKSPSTKKAIVSLLINLTKSTPKVQKVFQNVQAKFHEEKQKLQFQALSKKIKDLPSVEMLTLYLDNMYIDEKWIHYIVNYLLINYNVRNMDLNVKIIKFKKDAKAGGNYLIVRKKDILYVRKDYKTHAVYGDKEIVINSKKFRNAVENLDSEFLLPQNNNLARDVKKYTYDKHTESDYLKIILSALDLNKDKAKIFEISKNRGTDIGTLLSTYHATPE